MKTDRLIFKVADSNMGESIVFMGGHPIIWQYTTQEQKVTEIVFENRNQLLAFVNASRDTLDKLAKRVIDDEINKPLGGKYGKKIKVTFN